MSTPHCVTGSLHDGTPVGKLETINGVETYVALPKGDYPKDKALLMLPDVFALKLVNNKLLCDGFAENGIPTYMPDYLNGDAVDPEAMSTGKVDLPGWFKTHLPAQTRPPLDKLIAGLKERGVTTFASSGYCFGAQYMFHLAQENVIVVGAASHPSRLERPADIEKLLANSNAPVLINSCEHDHAFPPDFQKETDGILGDGKYKPGYKRTYYPGASHGFAVRADLSDPRQKAAKEGAFNETVAWTKRYLKL